MNMLNMVLEPIFKYVLLAKLLCLQTSNTLWYLPVERRLLRAGTFIFLLKGSMLSYRIAVISQEP